MNAAKFTKAGTLRESLNVAFPYTLDPSQIPTFVTTNPDPDSTQCAYHYACPDACWKEHLAAWSKQYRDNKLAPSPLPFHHCQFERPADYGSVPYGCTDPNMIRDAIEHGVRSDLHGWDRDVPKDRLDAIVKATVDAKLSGANLGAFPFMACIMSDI